jgi:hypothetical protein
MQEVRLGEDHTVGGVAQLLRVAADLLPKLVVLLLRVLDVNRDQEGQGSGPLDVPQELEPQAPSPRVPPR